MKNSIARMLCLVLFQSLAGLSGLGASDSGAAASTSALWSQLLGTWQQGLAYKAHRMQIRSDELDKNGRVTSTTVTDLSLSYQGGEARTEVLSSRKDGRDITAQTRAEYAKRERADSGRDSEQQGAMDPESFIPFSAAVQEFVRLGVSSDRNGRLVLPYRIEKPEYGSSGLLFFAADGSPERLEYELTKLPPMVSNFKGEMGFRRLAQAGLVMDMAKFEAEGGILLIRKRFAITMQMSDFRIP